MPRNKIFIALSVLLLASLACNFIAPTEPSTPPPMTVIVEPTHVSQQSVLQSEDEVPRVTIEVALTALQSGAAVIVDVRSKQSYDLSHIAGALSIPLAEIETNPTGLNLAKDQWIITYCTWQNEHTSARAAFVMINNGYTNVEALLGGFQAWLDAGNPVEP